MDNTEQSINQSIDESSLQEKETTIDNTGTETEKSEGAEQEKQSIQSETVQNNQAQEEKKTFDGELRKEVENLQKELDKQKNKTESFIDQMRELYQLYPNADINSLSDEIWQSVKAGVPIAAAYALNARRCEIEAERAEQANLKNKEKCIGGVGGNNDNGYFSPAEVRGMSAKEVRNNYTKIIDSMNHWN